MSTNVKWAAAVIPLLLACHPPQAAVQTRELLDRGNVDAAWKTIDRAVSEQPRSAALRRLALEVRLAQDDRPGAVKVYRGWLDQVGKDEEMLQHLALSVLRWGLRNRAPAVRLAAIQAARRTDADELERSVADRLEDPDETVRSWAAVAMSRTLAGADALERQLRSPDPRARAVAVGNLARIAGAAAVRTLTRLSRDPSPEVRAALARGLDRVGKDAAVGLLGRLARDPERTVRRDAVAALGRLGRPAGAKIVHAALTDPYIGVRVAAVLALAELEGDRAMPMLRELAEEEDLPTALRAGVRLARMGEDQPVLNAIAKGLVDGSWTVRAAACNAAASLGGKHAVARKLVADRALRDPEPRVRAAGARAVLALGDESAAGRTAALLQALSCSAKGEDMEALCLQAAEVLLRSGNRSGLHRLEQLARAAKAPAHRAEALRIALTGGGLLETAVDALADSEPSVAIAAATDIYIRIDRSR